MARPDTYPRARIPAHAAAADRRLSEEEARRIERENHLVEGEPVEQEAEPAPQEGASGWLW
jgi:hypothetical protein